MSNTPMAAEPPKKPRKSRHGPLRVRGAQRPDDEIDMAKLARALIEAAQSKDLTR